MNRKKQYNKGNQGNNTDYDGTTLISLGWIDPTNLPLVKEVGIINHEWSVKSFGGANDYNRKTLYNMVQKQITPILHMVSKFISFGLSISTKDYYIHYSFNGRVAVVAHYTGAIRMLTVKALKDYGYKLIVSADTITEGDKISKSSQNNIDDFIITKSQNSLLGGSAKDAYISSYSISTIYDRNDNLIFRKAEIIPMTEFSQIMAIAEKKKDTQIHSWRYAYATKASLWRAVKILKAIFGLADVQLEHMVEEESDEVGEPNQPTRPPEPILKNDISKLMDALEKYAKVVKSTKKEQEDFILTSLNTLKLKNKKSDLTQLNVDKIKEITSIIDGHRETRELAVAKKTEDTQNEQA